MNEQDAKVFQGKVYGGTSLQNLVVLIEDDDSLRSALEFVLKAERIRYLSTGDGMSGYALIRKARPKVVILDMYVPHRSGFEILDDLRADPVLESVFVIAITGMAEDEEELRAMKGSADVILSKPLDEEWLLQLVRQGLEQVRPGSRPAVQRTA